MLVVHSPRRARGAAALLAATLVALPGPVPAALELPPIDRIVHYQPKLPLQVVTADGVEIAQFGAERRIYVPLAQTPKLMQQALLAVEDTRFREHSGIDPKGMARAVLAMLTGGKRQGGSTITQQLVRTMLLTREFTAERKAKEIMLALKVEEALPKDRILEIYMNEIFLGQRAYGFAAAAQAYFGKPMDKLSIAESAMLAGLPQNPHYANPVANFERALARQRVVLQRMHETGVITSKQLADARGESLVIRPPGRTSVHAAHVAEMARLAVVQRYGAAAYASGLKVVTSLRAADQEAAHAALRRGVMAYDRRSPWRGPEDKEDLPAGDGPELERAAAQALKEHRDDEVLRVGIVLAASPKEVRLQLASGERVAVAGDGLRWAQPALQPKAKAPLRIERGSILRLVQLPPAARPPSPRLAKGELPPPRWAISQWPEAQAALVALDTHTGRVRALVGGFDFTRQPFNHVTQGWRQPGSSFKPFLYSAALEQRVMPASVIDDLPYTAANGWSPGNSDGQFMGPMTLRDALAKSRNLVSVRLLEHVGTVRARDWAARFGLDPARQPDNLTLALGTGSVTPMQMAQAYATFANGGWQVAPVVIEKIIDAQGKQVFEAPPAPAFTDANRVLPERNAFVTASLLNEVTKSGTAARAQAALRRADVYGKTGTTDDAVDAWFVGYQPSLATVVWMGFDEPKSLGERESGGGAALPIWIDYMAAALKGVPVAPPPAPPPGVVRSGEDWLYTEWQSGGWVQRIAADAGVLYAPDPAASAPGEAPAVVEAPAAAASAP
jgi:penicillin-binding protein 1A